jgi:hypothetical protein
MPKSLARYSAYEAVNVQELSYTRNVFTVSNQKIIAPKGYGPLKR